MDPFHEESGGRAKAKLGIYRLDQVKIRVPVLADAICSWVSPTKQDKNSKTTNPLNSWQLPRPEPNIISEWLQFGNLDVLVLNFTASS